MKTELRSLLSSNAEFEFHKVKMHDDEMNLVDVGVLIIHKAMNHTVTFQKIEFIRVGSYTKKLKELFNTRAKIKC